MALNPNMALPVDVVLTAGQSNMSGFPGTVGNPAAPSTTTGLCWDYKATGVTRFVQVADPTSSDTTYRPNNGSCVPSFVNTFTAASERSIVVVRAARGGTSLLAANEQFLGNGHWDVAVGNCFDDSVDRLLDAIDEIETLGHIIGNVFVIWSQGGRDVIGGQDLELYEAANAALVERWRTATGIPTIEVFMEELSSILGGEGAYADEITIVRAAENSAVLYTEGLHMAFNEGKDYVNRVGWMRSDDKIHYMQVGLNYMGYQMGLYVAEHYGFSVDPVDPPVEDTSRRTSLIAHRLRFADPLPPIPAEWMKAGTYSWLCPFGVTAVKIEAWGAGGGGRGGVSLGRGGMGGGSGEYRIIASQAVVPGTTYTIIVGAGGLGSTYNTNDGTNGADSSFSGATLTAKGGGKPPTASTVGPGGTGGSGGTGTSGNAGGSSVNSSGSDGAAGGSAPGGGGTGGAGGITGSILGKVGGSPGAGGGGGKGNVAGANGGNGAAGGVRISAV